MGHDPDHATLWRQAAEAAIAYRRGIGDRPQRPDALYREALAAFDAPVPESGLPPDAVVGELVERATPGLGAMTGPRFFGWVIGGSHPVGVAADWLTSAWGQNVGNHVTSPAGAAVETVAARWLLDILKLPPQASVGFVTGATMANVVGLAAARGEVLRGVGWNVEADGLFGAPPVSVLIGDDAHTSVFAALQFLGFGHGRVVRVATDGQGAMLSDAVETALRACAGPVIVITQVGQINTGAFDAHDRIVPMAHARGAWVHVDGAFGLWARACPARAHLAAGVDGADSWATDGHKWLQTPYDCGYAIVRDADAHRRAMTSTASYLPTADEGERDPSHFVPELSRRARGFATWAMIRHLGRHGIADMVERHCRLARRMAEDLAADPRIETLNDVVLNQAVVRFTAGPRFADGDELTRRVIWRLQEDGTCFAGGATWRGRWVMRLSVIGAQTTDADVGQAVEAIKRALDAVVGSGG